MTSWARTTSPDLGDLVTGAGRSVAVLPIGATEQHGAHLPTGTDTLLAETVCREACRRRGVLMLPALPYGCSYGHTNAWPGTLSLSPGTLTSVVCEIARWAIDANRIDRILFVSGHATNGPPIESAILQLRHEYPHARFAARGLWDLSDEARRLYSADVPDMHANIAETAMVLAIDPQSVYMDRAEDVDDVTVGRIWRYAMPAVTSCGVVGHPSRANAENGQAMLDRLISDLTLLLESAESESWPAIPIPARPGRADKA